MFRPEKFTKKHILEVLPPDLAQITMAHPMELFRSGKARHYEYPLEVDGGQKLYESRLAFCGDDRGLAIVRDITNLVGFDAVNKHKSFSKREIALLSVLSEIISKAYTRKQSEEALQESENRFRAFLQNLPLGAYRVTPDSEGEFLMANPAFLHLFGLENEEELKKMKMSDLYYDPADRVRAANRIIDKGGYGACELKLKKKDGEIIYCLDTAQMVCDSDGNPLYFDCMLEDITQRKQAEEKIRYMSFHDQLTGLYNRHYLEKEMERLDTERQLPISIIMADLNGLKLVNDNYGHQSGDKMLKQAAAILRKSCRDDDLIARFGGDEFVLYLPQTSAKEALRISSRIEKACRKEQINDVPISLSTGVAFKTSAKQMLHDVLKEAEDNMYQNKLTESRSAKSAIVNTLLQTLAAKSFETEAHTRNMQETARIIGKKLGLPHSELHRLHLLITLHDIGKINIPENLLIKKGTLSADEWEVMKKHCETGYRIARTTDDFVHVAEEILAHHERFDGSGYPQKQAGEEIPLLARITAIADAYEVMSNGRPYKKAMSLEEIVDELKRCSGTQFDPELVEIFLSSIETKN